MIRPTPCPNTSPNPARRARAALAGLVLGAAAALPAASRDAATMVPAMRIDSEHALDRVVTLVDAFRLFDDPDYAGQAPDQDPSDINFFYASGRGYIVDRRVKSRALPPWFGGALDAILTLPTNSDDCYIQDVLLDGGPVVTAVIHDEDGDDPEDVYRCLVAGLWYVSQGSLDGLDIMDWRASYRDLLADGGGGGRWPSPCPGATPVCRAPDRGLPDPAGRAIPPR